MDPQVLSQTLNDSMFVLPEAMLALFGLAILLTDFFLARNQKSWNSLTALLGVGFSAGSLYSMYEVASQNRTAFSNSIVIDPFFVFFSALFLTDAEGTNLSWSRGAEQLTAWRAEEIIGQPDARLYPASDAERDMPAKDRAEAVKLGTLHKDGWRVRRGGSEFACDAANLSAVEN